MSPNEQFVGFTPSQDLATCSYARHRCGFVGNLSEFKHKEQVYNLRYIYIGISEMNKLNSDDPLWSYIKDNYGIDLVGLMEMNNQLVPMHIILKRGKKFGFNDISTKKPQLAKKYDTKQGQIPYYYIQNTQ